MTEELRTKDALSSWPKRLYLQRDDDCVAEGCEMHDDTSWCAKKINDGDVEYVRADTVTDLRGALKAARRYVEAYVPPDVSEAHDRDLLLQSIEALQE